MASTQKSDKENRSHFENSESSKMNYICSGRRTENENIMVEDYACSSDSKS